MAVATTRFAYPRGSLQNANAEPRKYHKMDDAAIAVLREYNPYSILFNIEYGGRICQTSGDRYFANVPRRGIVYTDTVEPSDCPAGAPWVGQYHTHGRWGNDGFSSVDIANADKNPGKAWYVATPCGHIDKYVGPDFAEYLRFPEKTRTTIKCVP